MACIARGGRIAWVVALLALAVPTCVHAAFEDVEVSPRARALGSSTMAMLSDEYAVFHNPATLAWAARPAGAASYLRPFGYDFSALSTVAYSQALPGRLGGVGLGVRHFGVEYEGQALTSETTVSLGQGFHLLRDHQSEVAVGWSLNLYSLSYGPSIEIDMGSGPARIDPGSAHAFGVNLGGAAVVRERTRVGFSVVNVDNPRIGERDSEELHRRVSVGLSYSPYPGVATVLDIANELGRSAQYRGGAEFQISDFLWLRTGLHTEPSTFTAGFGLRHAGLSLDYGYSTGGGVLGDTHHLGLGFSRPGTK